VKEETTMADQHQGEGIVTIALDARQQDLLTVAAAVIWEVVGKTHLRREARNIVTADKPEEEIGSDLLAFAARLFTHEITGRPDEEDPMLGIAFAVGFGLHLLMEVGANPVELGQVLEIVGSMRGKPLDEQEQRLYLLAYVKYRLSRICDRVGYEPDEDLRKFYSFRR
jgi:hypothetical protein